SVIRIRFRLCDVTGRNLSSPTVVPVATRVRNSAIGFESAANGAGNDSVDGLFRLTGGAYTFNLKTTGLPSGIYQLLFTVDGVEYSVPFVIRPSHDDAHADNGQSRR